MKCPFYNCDSNEDNPNFDEPAAHLIITVGVLGHTHIHAPFEDAFIMRKMASTLISEMQRNGIKFSVPEENQGGGELTND